MDDEGIHFLIICIAMGIYYSLLTYCIYDVKQELKRLSKKIDELKEKQNG